MNKKKIFHRIKIPKLEQHFLIFINLLAKSPLFEIVSLNFDGFRMTVLKCFSKHSLFYLSQLHSRSRSENRKIFCRTFPHLTVWWNQENSWSRVSVLRANDSNSASSCWMWEEQHWNTALVQIQPYGRNLSSFFTSCFLDSWNK